MTPKEFYTCDESSPDLLDFKPASAIAYADLVEGGVWRMPEGNAVGFKGPKGLFRYARQRLSEDGSGIQIASLAGSLLIPLGSLDPTKPMGLMCVYGADWTRRESIVATVGRDWAPMTERAKGRLQARRISDGCYEPLGSSTTMRGLDGTTDSRLVLLPAPPTKAVDSGDVMELEAAGKIFELSEPMLVMAARAGKAVWIIPDEEGNFINLAGDSVPS